MCFMNKKYFKQSLKNVYCKFALIPYFSYFFNIINRAVYHLNCIYFCLSRSFIVLNEILRTERTTMLSI